MSSTRLITAAHVINGASTIVVRTDKSGDVRATILGINKAVDLAVLRLARPVRGQVFTLARKTPSPGTQVIAIGYPLAGPKTLTEGTVSGVGRKIRTESGTQTDLLQTDAPINPGNSGGPLLDMQARVVGFADAVRTDAQGIGYAVPSTDIRPYLARPARALTPVSAVSCTLFNSSTGAAAIETVVTYHEAINTLDYAWAMSLLTNSYARQLFPNQSSWYNGYATTYDDDFDVPSGRLSGASADVDLRFRSQQAPGYGPPGAIDATCLRWNVTYHLVKIHGDWLINGATPNDPAWRLC